MGISLKEVTQENWEACIDLKVSKQQEAFIASNCYSLVQANYEANIHPLCIYCDDEIVGFLMYDKDPDTQRMEVSRFMIDQRYQGQGIK